MPHSSDHNTSRPAADRRPDPFASISGPSRRRRRFWLVDLVMGPFLDPDERATYHAAGKDAEARSAAGIRAGKAWHGNGAPTADPQPRFGGTGAPEPAPEGFPASTRATRFSSVARPSVGR